MAMQIPFLDLLRQQPEIDAEIKAAVMRVLDGGVYILGREVAAFETAWARYCGVRAAVGDEGMSIVIAALAQEG